VLVAGNGDSIFKRLMTAIDREDLGRDPELAHNPGRVARVEEIDRAIEAWTTPRAIDEVLALLNAAEVPVGKVYTAADIAADPHYQARGMLLPQTTREGRVLTVPGIVPKLLGTPGSLRTPAPRLGEDSEGVLAGLGLSVEQIAALRARGVVG
jgi:formyl-CoA transferase